MSQQVICKKGTVAGGERLKVKEGRSCKLLNGALTVSPPLFSQEVASTFPHFFRPGKIGRRWEGDILRSQVAYLNTWFKYKGAQTCLYHSRRLNIPPLWKLKCRSCTRVIEEKWIRNILEKMETENKWCRDKTAITTRAYNFVCVCYMCPYCTVWLMIKDME